MVIIYTCRFMVELIVVIFKIPNVLKKAKVLHIFKKKIFLVFF